MGDLFVEMYKGSSKRLALLGSSDVNANGLYWFFARIVELDFRLGFRYVGKGAA